MKHNVLAVCFARPPAVRRAGGFVFRHLTDVEAFANAPLLQICQGLQNSFFYIVL